MFNFKILAVDFDGTLCENRFPDIGLPNTEFIEYLKSEKVSGTKLILWTCRTGLRLTQAYRWCLERGLEFDAINQNIPEVVDKLGKGGPKIYADEYIDDKASSRFTLPFIKDLGEVSDGYHTFNGLYAQRRVLFATLCNIFKGCSWKSRKHSDGELCFGGDWFIVGIDTPEGSYTYHYQMEYWKMFNCEELAYGKEWDGHTEKDVDRLLSLENADGAFGRKLINLDLEEYSSKVARDGLSYSMSSDHGGCKYV